VAGFGWLLGELASVNAVTQLGLVSLLVLAVPVLLGWRLALAMIFPLAYLFFAVPIGEFVMPQFMEWTADFTVAALQLTGIPVYREGLHFVIPSGRWSVVEACSGVRYLIASLVVGTLYAYLNYRSLHRRLIFVGVSLLVPIVANWLRAYMIVMIGHLSGNTLAVGVDHLIYGWVFFGVVIMLMFWIGGRWAEHPDPAEAVATNAAAASPAGAGRPWLVAVLTAAVIALPHLALLMIDGGNRTGKPAVALAAPDGWRPSAPITSWRPAFEGASAEVRQDFVRDGKLAGIFIGYYRHQDYEHKLVSSSNTLVRSEQKEWQRVAGGSQTLAIAGQPVQAGAAELRGPGEQRLLVWQWYWINGRLTANQARAKAYTAWSRLTGQGDDSAVVIVYAPKGENGGADDLAAFVEAAGAGIDAALHQARQQP
jgi:exosortase A